MKLTLTTFILLILFAASLQAQVTPGDSGNFITTWKTDNPGDSNNNQITIPTSSGSYNYDIYWEDVTDAADNGMINGNTGDLTITFPDGAGTYRVEIAGDFPAINFANTGDKEKILTIEQWGDIEWESMQNAFLGTSNLVINAADAPDLSGVTTLNGMFQGATSLNSDLNHWDVSTITEMVGMFISASAFNGNISGWDVSNVENMAQMFWAASSFNGDISGWVTDNVTDMNFMFNAAAAFNQDIGNWNVSDVTNMFAMFNNASTFNQDLSSWNVSNVTNMQSMFRSASSFNGDISGWDTDSATEMSYMFDGASAFNRDLGGWNVSNVTDMEGMLVSSNLSTINYDATLIGWEGQSVQNNIQLDAFGLEYCSGETARDNLIANYNWTITGDALAAGCSGSTFEPFITTWKTDNPGTSGSNQITIPTDGVSTYNYNVYWEDVSNAAVNGTELGATGDLTITFPAAGTYRVEIAGEFPRINFNNGGDKEKILTIEQWGDVEWTSMENAFYGASNLGVNAPDAPDLSNVTSMASMFRGASSLNADLNHWDVTGVTSMAWMFNGASAFNGDISNWNVTNVTTMREMFLDAGVFNGDISSWIVSNVEDMTRMFSNAAQFNQDITNWNVGSVTDMGAMFALAAAFDQNLGNWDVSSVTDMSDMLNLSGLSTANYDATLIDWAAQPLQNGVALGAIGLEYCDGDDARNDLINNFNWTITGDALGAGCGPGLPFITTWKTDNPGTSGSNQITIPTFGGSFNYDVYWEDVTNAAVNGTENNVTGDLTIMFPAAGTYRVEISDDFSQIIFNDGGDKEKILTIEQWGDIEWENLSNSFYGASNLQINATDAPNLSGLTSLFGMFRSASSLDSNLNHWDVSGITNMNFMFFEASSFNKDLSGWNISNVTNTISMFFDATAFDQDLGGWDVSSVIDMQHMFSGSGLSTANYDATLIGWAAQAVQNGITLGADGLEYCDGENARDDLVTNSNWTIVGDAFAVGCGQAPFTTTWKTDNSGTSNDNQITIPANEFSTYSYDVYWEDVTDENVNGTETGVTGDLTITFPAIGTYRVEIFGDFPAIYFNDEGDKEKILTIEQWGDIEWETMVAAFRGASNLQINALDAPDLSGVTNMLQMFRGATSLNSDLNHWDASTITNMTGMFTDAQAFNGDISSWNVSNVMGMNGMFAGAHAFNGDITAWNVGNVADMTQMFSSAFVFDKNLGGWNIENVANMNFMLSGSGLSIANYDATLIGWASQNVNSGIDLGAAGLEYCTSQSARQSLISDDSWTITGDAPATSCDPYVLLTGGEDFRLLTSPVEVSLADLLGPIWTQGATGADYTGGDPNVWTWDNSLAGDDPADWVPVTDLSATLAAGTGVLVYVFDEDEYGDPGSAGFPKTLSVSGTVNTLPQTPPINTNPGGFTLLGNPVNTGIDWDEVILNQVESTVYVWDPAAGDYIHWNGSAGDLTDGILHPFQGFFVQTSSVTAPTPSLEIPVSAATSPGDFYGKDKIGEDPLVVRLHLSGGDSLQSTAWLQFSEEGSLTRNSTDAVKLQPLAADYAVLGLEPFSDDESSLLALKHLPLELDTPLEIPLTATTTQGGTFTLAATDMTLPDGWILSLRDTRTDEKVSVEQGMEYTFEVESDKATKDSPLKRGARGVSGLNPRPLLTAKAKSTSKTGPEARFLLTITPAGAIKADLPEQITLEQNYPNPFNPATVISYQLPAISQVRLEVYDMVGRRVATLVDAQVGAGTHQVNFNAGNLSSGIYLYRLQTSDAVFTKKLTLIK